MGKRTAIVLAAGSGKRMNTGTKKQYLLIKGKPLLYYSLKAFSESTVIDEIVLVTSKDDAEFVKEEIVDKYHINKVSAIVEGGKERYNSVYNGLLALENCEYVFIHDGARPFINEEILVRAFDKLTKCGSAVVGMPVKDTIKIVDDEAIVKDTPNRKSVWQVQTPQCFKFDIVKKSYDNLIACEKSGILNECGIQVTDDAMVVETFLYNIEENAKECADDNFSVHLVEGSYENIKITTPEDLIIAEAFLK